MVQAVHDNEPDTLIYIAHRSEDSPQDMLFYEVYRNEAAKHAHGNTPYLAELVKDIGTVFDAEFGVKIENLGRVAACVRD